MNDSPVAIDRACEEILLSSGLHDEAYRQYGLTVNRGGTNLATFRNIRVADGVLVENGRTSRQGERGGDQGQMSHALCNPCAPVMFPQKERAPREGRPSLFVFDDVTRRRSP